MPPRQLIPYVGAKHATIIRKGQYVSVPFSLFEKPKATPEEALEKKHARQLREPRGRDDLNKILREVCSATGADVQDVIGDSRSAHLVFIRSMYASRARSETNASTSQIGTVIYRDHTTILNLLRRSSSNHYESYINQRKVMKQIVDLIDGGKSRLAVAEMLGISYEIVKKRYSTYKKENSLQLV